MLWLWEKYGKQTSVGHDLHQFSGTLFLTAPKQAFAACVWPFAPITEPKSKKGPPGEL